jgi:outer membrane protein
MSMMTKLMVGCVVCMSAAMGAQAYEAGDWIVRGGAATVEPNDSSSTVQLNNAAVATDGRAEVNSNTQLGVTVAYMLTPNVGVELLAATPFKHKITANGSLAGALGNNDLGSTEQLPPTLSAQYYFNNSSGITPYAGLGLNYTTFFHETVDSDMEAALGGHSTLEVQDSWGLAAEAGVDIDLGSNWLLNAAIWYIDIDTTATFTTPAGKVKTDVDVDPWVYMVGVGYKF